MSTFAGIEMGKRALNAFRLGMDTVGHNVSNMNTEGYSRQRVNYATVTPQDIPNTGQLGQGVTVNEIKRIRDDFLDLQYRTNQADLGYWEKINDLYDAIQNYIAEPDSEGVRTALDTFYSAVQSVQQTPESSAARRSLVESAQSLSNALDVVTNGFDNYAKAVNADVKSAVDEANEILHEIAALNKVIYQAEATNQNANDYLDQRDLLIDKLSSMIDMTYQEPLTYGENKGEFFLTLNGRALIQGDHVRELKAHAFQWDNQVYYDVQVAENEFDIVSDCTVADILATGPEGVHQLVVDRLANGKEWDAGGGDAYCMDTVSVTSAQFDGGILLDADDEDISRKISIRAFKSDNTPVVLTLKIDHDDNAGWVIRAEKDTDGNQIYPDSSTGVNVTLNGESKYAMAFGDELTIDELKGFIEDAISADSDLNDTSLELTANADPDDSTVNNSLTISSSDNTAITVTDYSGMLGSLSIRQVANENVPMRVRPADTDEALGLTGSFRLQVGTQGTRVTSLNLNKDHGDFAAGDILGAGEAGERHTMRIGAAGDQLDITASWNSSTQKWELTSDIFISGVNTPDTYPVSTSTSKLTIEELSNFIEQAAKAETSVSESGGFVVKSGPASGTKTQFYIESKNNYLMSISDVEGNLAATLGMVNTNPVIEINVEESDTLEIIRNKINEKYQAEFGLTEPEQWVHASLKQDSDQSWYLSIAANVPGEAQRITLMGDTSGDMQLLRRLGLVTNQKVVNGDEYGYREVTYFSSMSQDASFKFDNVRYLSSDNMFNQARRVPATGNDRDYTAKTITEVSEGMWFNLKGSAEDPMSGSTAIITVRHHVKNGSIKALEEARDKIIPNLKSQIDEAIFGLVKNFNAYNYSGYGIGDDITTTGTAFFNSLSFKSGASKNLSVNNDVIANNALIGAAMGKKGEDGKAVSGVTGGSGDGTNAGRMAGLTYDKIMMNGTMTIGGVYDAMLSEFGSGGGNAALMLKTYSNVADQIDSQRQAVSGVNLDEELMDIIVLNRAFGAMSRYVTAMDEMLNTIINGFGLVGR